MNEAAGRAGSPPRPPPPGRPARPLPTARGGRTSDLATLSAVAEALNAPRTWESALTRTLALVAQRWAADRLGLAARPRSELVLHRAVYNLPPSCSSRCR